MVKLLLASALAAVAMADGNDPGIRARCRDDNTIAVAIDYPYRSADILSASYGSCNKTQMTGADKTGAYYWVITLDPARCGMESKLRNLVYNQTANFVIGRKDGNTEIVFSTMSVDSYCNYTSEYTVTFSYGPVSADSYDFTDSGGLLGLNFYIKSYSSSSYDTAAAPSTQAGKKIYLKLALNGTLNADFDHATSMSASTGKVFVPTKCEVADTNSNTYTLFDATAVRSKCVNSVIDLSLTYNAGSSQSWYISHTLFLLNDEDSSSYTLSCNILVCDVQSANACKTVESCYNPMI